MLVLDNKGDLRRQYFEENNHIREVPRNLSLNPFWSHTEGIILNGGFRISL
jgi:hypothetical protein